MTRAWEFNIPRPRGAGVTDFLAEEWHRRAVRTADCSVTCNATPCKQARRFDLEDQMPTTICQNGHVAHWRNQRGAKMPKACGVCGEANTRAVAEFEWDADGNIKAVRYVTAPQRAKRWQVECWVCHRKRQAPSRAVKQFERPVEVYNDPGVNSLKTWVPVGMYVCWYHNPVEAEVGND